MKSTTKALAFPLAGVSRRGSYRQANRPPFTAPWAVNVRTVGVSELRRRGGSRPGLARHSPTRLGNNVTALFPVSYLDSSGTLRHDLVYVADLALGRVRDGVATAGSAELEGPDGVDILAEDGTTLDFSSVVVASSIQGAVRAGRVYFADNVLRVYDPSTGVMDPVLPTTAAAVPTGQPIVAAYRDRIFLGGLTNAYYASRVSDPGDWDFGAAIEDPSGAALGQLSIASETGFVLTAMVPIGDRVLVMASANSLWALRGDPRGGRLDEVSAELGIIAQDAWAVSPDGLLCFLSADGIYLWDPGAGQAPQRFSAERLPDELREVDPTEVVISMTYDMRGRGFHLFLTADEGPSNHWWIDPENRAFWPQRFRDTHEPFAAAMLADGGLGRVVLACRDGYLREFSDAEHQDDGHDLESHVLIGPIQVQGDDVRDGMVAEVHGALEGVAPEGGKVRWRLVTGRSPAEAAEAAYADMLDVLDDLEPSRSQGTGEWGEGRGFVDRPRVRGAWVVVWLSSVASWSYELAAIVVRELGRHR